MYFIRTKSYYKYAVDLFKDLYKHKEGDPALYKKAREIFEIGLKAVWSLSQITPPKEKPTFEELYKKTLESLSPEDASTIQKIYQDLFSKELSKEEILNRLDTYLSVLREALKPVL